MNMQLELPFDCFKYRVGDYVQVMLAGEPTPALIQDRWWSDERTWEEQRDDKFLPKRTLAMFHVLIEVINEHNEVEQWRYVYNERNILGHIKVSWEL